MQSNTISTLKKMVTQPYFSLFCFISLIFILPRYGATAMMVGSASVLSLYVSALPGSFRSRSGSMTAAVCLIAAMWIAAVVIAALTLMGELGD